MAKKLIALLLTLAMALGMVPAVYAADAAPTSITVDFEENPHYLASEKLLVAEDGETFQLVARDQNGDPTPVTWSTTSAWCCSVSETGLVTITGNPTGGGSTSYMYITAQSTLDESVKAEGRFSLKGWKFSSDATSVELSRDGQSQKTVSISGGLDGHNTWSYDEKAAAGLATLAADPGKGTSIKFNAHRPGKFNVTVKVDLDEAMTDTMEVNITGVAVEDPEGNQGKTSLMISKDQPNPTVQLTAFCMEGKTIASWAGSDETVATVDETGKVTAQGVGTVLITATDSDGQTGGIKVVVSHNEIPYFESLEFMASALNGWKAGETFRPTQLEYDLNIRSYGTTQLVLQATTLYDAERYEATAYYINASGEQVSEPVNSGKITYLKDIPFDKSDVTITLADRAEPEVKTTYTFHVTRPRDTSKKLKNNTGLVLEPEGRNLLATKYNGYAEGTMWRAGEDGTATTSRGVTGSVYYYRTYALGGLEQFQVTVNASTNYAHIRYSADDGKTWKELPQGSGTTNAIAFPEVQEGNAQVKVRVQLLDDSAYTATAEGKDPYAENEVTEYTLWVEQVDASLDAITMLTAQSDAGQWYPAFAGDLYSYNIVIDNDAELPILRYTVSEGAVVKVGTKDQAPEEDGSYVLPLKTSNQTVNLSSADGMLTNSYTFKAQKRSKYDVPDRVVDFLCIGSQYTNGGYGIQPEATLSGSLKSLGNFGGYITYYYEKPLTNDPRNRYGVDFYVYGNAFDNGGSAAEPGQVYVSEDGQTWYALAGSEHYSDNAIWDYTITYENRDGKSYWTDNQGNTMTARAMPWPSKANYYLNDVWAKTSYTATGVLLKSNQGSVMGDSTTGTFATQSSFGYADCFANGTVGADVNPYTPYPSKSSGFDLAWAVDAAGNPVDVSGKAFHYVKVMTASNIWAGAFNEKSTEVTYVVRTTAQQENVGKTATPEAVVISNGSENCEVALKADQQVYNVDLAELRSVESLSVRVKGASAEDNVYVNNQRIAADASAEGLSLDEQGQRLVRLIVQNGEQEPVVVLLKLTNLLAEEKAAADEVEAMIDQLGEITNESGPAIEAVRAAYEALSETAKKYVRNLAKLEAAEEAYQTICDCANGAHEVDQFLLVKQATCTETGVETGTCIHCGQLVTRTTAALGHQANDGVVVEEATCTKEGKLEYTCAVCHETWTEATPKLPHTYDSQTAAPTCEGVGYTAHTCTVCGERYLSDLVPATGHTMADTVVAPTCDSMGYTIHACTVCGFATVDTFVAASDHKYAESARKEATCTTEGQIVWACRDCGKTYTQTLPKAEHDWKETIVKATCTDYGYVEKACQNCGEQMITGLERPLGHDYQATVVAPTLDAGGYTLHTCTRCQDSYRDSETEALSHLCQRYEDLPQNWAREGICYVTERGLMNGVSETSFAPNQKMNRAMAVTVLYRMAGSEKVEEASTFDDVQKGAYYYDAVLWATCEGITNGVSQTSFAPTKPVSREELVTFFHRYAKLLEADLTAAADLSGYTDASDLHDFAKEAMAWAVGSGVINGMSETTLAPCATATRAEAAAIMMRLLRLLEQA